jgi:hypothetical protein
MPITEVIKERIKKLIALSGSPNEAEASLAMSKCRELMEKYDIRSVDLDETEKTVDVKMVWVKGYNEEHKHWESKLGASIAENFDAQALWKQTEGGWSMIFVATKTDAEFVSYLYKNLRRSISKMAKEYVKDIPGDTDSIHYNYCLGMCQTIYYRLMKLYKAIPDTKALVPIKKSAIDKALEGWNINPPEKSKITDLEAFEKGEEDAEKIGLGRPITQGKERGQLNA